MNILQKAYEAGKRIGVIEILDIIERERISPIIWDEKSKSYIESKAWIYFRNKQEIAYGIKGRRSNEY